MKKIINIFDNHRNLWQLVFMGLLALIVRLPLFRYGSLDYQKAFAPLYEFVSSHPVIFALAHDPSSYTPIYTYFLIIASRLFSTLPPLFVVKLVSISFDYLCAFFVYQLIKLNYPEKQGFNSILPVLGYVAVLFSPTVILNSAFWGQVDAVYTAGLLGCLYFLIRKKETLAFVAFGLAVAFKLQAVFLIPLLLILFFQKYLRWKSFLIIPLVYLLSILPPFIAGRPITSLFSVYLTQSDVFHRLAMNVTNLYQWLPNKFYDIFYPAGVALTVSVIIVLCIITNSVKVVVEKHFMILTALFSCILLPYILPKMHDRYFFPADVISIVFAFYFPRYYYIPIVVGLISFFSYGPALFYSAQFPLPILAIAMGVVLIIIAYLFLRTLFLNSMTDLSGAAANDKEPGMSS